ncbi:hypothetical protein G4X40_19740 [Rhodococcus sp. D2-41]|uniref:Tail terminator n=1 Tax=Speluncibacter jeojiensis TaxID=2710754 RepID=A0A9X4M1Q3_9ACTN|nr:hypothetical protein [Rhodococcus sp. D2-41]MDG3012376.1 hypothetical protein [Rhodococcus sp. D2-41]MDG3013548.1 hypothetical protein [Corynebacteriales bacterium D3-21]
MFIDTEQLLVAYLQPIAPNQVSVEMPNTPPLPFILVSRVAGGDDRETDLGIADVHVFHNSRDQARQTARQMHNLIQQLTAKTPVTILDGGPTVHIDRIITIHGPAWVDWQDENLKRYVARYEVASRINSQPL